LSFPNLHNPSFSSISNNSKNVFQRWIFATEMISSLTQHSHPGLIACTTPTNVSMTELPYLVCTLSACAGRDSSPASQFMLTKTRFHLIGSSCHVGVSCTVLAHLKLLSRDNHFPTCFLLEQQEQTSNKTQTSSAPQIKASLQDKQTNSMCQLQGTMHIRRSTVPSGPITKIPCNYVVTREWDMFLEPGTDFLQSPS